PGAERGAAAAVKAAYSATFGLLEAVTTPMPPSTTFLKKIGTPPGFTAPGSLSMASTLPVSAPRPKPPASESDRGSLLSNVGSLARVQPRLVLSIPYKSAFG